MNINTKMSDKESFEDNENIIMNLNNNPDKKTEQSRGNNFFHIQLDNADTKRKNILNQPQKEISL